MARRKSKLAGSLHIKQNTQGTSNELSFSVLDARKQRADAGSDTNEVSWGVLGGESSKTGGQRTSSKRAVSRETSMPYNPDQEIARRKRRRRLSRVISGVVGTLLLVAVAGVAGWYIYQDIRVQDTTRGELHEAVALVAETDETVLTLDDLLKQEVDETTVEEMQALQKGFPEAEKKLDTAGDEAAAVVDTLHGSKDREAAGQAANAAAARVSMFEAGSEIIDKTIDVFETAQRAETAWSDVLAADALAREASHLVTDTTPDNVQRASEKANEAIEAFNQASSEFSALRDEKARDDMQAYVDYIAKRVESLGYALLSNEAILVQDKQTAESFNEQYNAADAEAAAMAAALPKSPTEALYDEYDNETAALFDEYNNARATASAADSFLRDYLGEVS